MTLPVLPAASVYIALTIAFTVYGQLVIKWQVSQAGAMPVDTMGKVAFLGTLLLNPWVISGFASAFAASLAWMAAMTKFPLSVAYPFMSLNFVAVLILSAWFFNEGLTAPKLVGMALLVLGLVVGAQKW